MIHVHLIYVLGDHAKFCKRINLKRAENLENIKQHNGTLFLVCQTGPIISELKQENKWKFSILNFYPHFNSTGMKSVIKYKRIVLTKINFLPFIL